MRVVGGRLGGRRLRAVPGSATRPTSDRVREALFGVLGARVDGARVLDLYAGTGALAIEALSRGAAGAVLVEHSATAVAVIRRNLADLELEDLAGVRRTRAETYVRANGRAHVDGPFGLVFLDPPYDTGAGVVTGVLARMPALLIPGATVVVEAAARREAPVWPGRLEPERPRRYGDTSLHVAVLGADSADGML